jgi:hypothetical protein
MKLLSKHKKKNENSNEFVSLDHGNPSLMKTKRNCVRIFTISEKIKFLDS